MKFHNELVDLYSALTLANEALATARADAKKAKRDFQDLCAIAARYDENPDCTADGVAAAIKEEMTHTTAE